MKMSGIVIGGVLGAAAAMYFNRNRAVSFAGIGNAGQLIDNVVEKARSKMMTPDKRSYYGSNHQSSPTASQTNTTSTATSGAGLAQVQSIVDKDPALKSQVNDILQDGR